jgi:hypothetical protein
LERDLSRAGFDARSGLVSARLNEQIDPEIRARRIDAARMIREQASSGAKAL